VRIFRSAKHLLNPHRWLDAFFAYCRDGLWGFRHVLNEMATFRLEPKAKKPEPWRPQIELLEIRQMPTTVQFSAASMNVNEDLSSATVTAVLNSASAGTITVNYSTSDNTAIAGTDYTSTSGTLTFIPGATSATFSVPLLNYVESSNVDFDTTLSSPTGATLGSPSTEDITIIQPPTVQLSASSMAVNETDSSAVLTATLSYAWDTAVTAVYGTSNGTAIAGTDYTSTSGTLTIGASKTSTTINVPLLNYPESSDVAFDMTLSSPTVASLGSPAAETVTIDQPPVASNDTYGVMSGLALNVPAASGVLANDTDPSGSPLTASLVSGPSHGSVCRAEL